MLELFHNHKSTCSQKVRLCLAELDLPWQGRHVDLTAGEHLTAEYLAINPNGVVPALRHDGQVVIESAVICEYLAEVFPGRARLVPDDAIARARLRAWLRYVDEVPSMAIRIPSYNLRVLAAYRRMSEEQFAAYAERMPLRKHFLRRMGRGGFDDAETRAAHEQLEQTLERMEGMLAAGPWLMGADYTLADICVLPVLVRMADLEMAALWADRPGVTEWYARALARPSFAAAYYPGSRMDEPLPVTMAG